MTQKYDDGALDRAIGALLGLAVGDAVGTTVEFRARGSFEPLTDMVGGGPFDLEPGQWTDDTSMAVCLAESLLDTGGTDLADQMRRYVLWSNADLSSTKYCFDIGGTTQEQLARFEQTGEPVDPDVDEGDAPNGSMMRLAPVPIRYFADTAEAVRRSAESSSTTHGATRPTDACKVMGAIISTLVRGGAWASVTDPDFFTWGELDPEIAAVVAGSWRSKTDRQISGKGFCVTALEAALWAVDGADDFGEAVLRAANLGDDADTTAAIAGQLAGARWGASGIRADWVEKVALAPRLIEMARQLYRAGGGEIDGSEFEGGTWPHDEYFHAYWVRPDQLLAGETPASQEPPKDEAKVNLLIDAGVRTFVDLTEDGELDPYAHLVDEAVQRRRLDVQRVSFSIPDMDVAAPSVYDDVLALIDEASARGAVYVHCWGGMGRTGTVIGCLLIDGGMSYAETIAELIRLRAGTRKARFEVPQARSQHDLLIERARRLSEDR